MALDAASPLPTAKDANFFYPDGTIILAVGCGREDASLFCIYKTQLAQQRDVFRDMLSLPQPAVTPRGIPADAENMEGVEDRPVLQMDDEVKDVRTTFTLLWDIPSAEPTLAELLGVFRISTKYMLGKAREWSLRRIESDYPSGPTELMNLTHFARWREDQNAVDLVLASKLCEVPSLLPYPYNALATANWSDKAETMRIGLGRVSPEQILALAAGRTFLQEAVSKQLIAGGPQAERIGYQHQPATCTTPCISGPCMTWNSPGVYLLGYTKRADLILWIKEKRASLNTGAWSFCAACQQAWIQQSEAKIRETYAGFCQAMEIGGHKGSEPVVSNVPPAPNQG